MKDTVRRRSVTGSETVCACYDSGLVSLGTGKIKDTMRQDPSPILLLIFVMTVWSHQSWDWQDEEHEETKIGNRIGDGLCYDRGHDRIRQAV